MIYVGVDPGKSGAIARISNATADVIPMPVIRGNRKGRDEYDLTAIRLIIADYHECFAMVERSQPMPPKMRGTIANFQRGVARGWEWLLVGMGISYQMVRPAEWQKEMHAGTSGQNTKQRSIIAAQRLFPEVSLLRTERSKKPDHNLAEALLLAEYGRRKYWGNSFEKEDSEKEARA
jgi:hypothetical protein